MTEDDTMDLSGDVGVSSEKKGFQNTRHAVTSLTHRDGVNVDLQTEQTVPRMERLMQHDQSGAGPAFLMDFLASQRPWLQFVATDNFKVPPSVIRRFYRNVEYFQANYLMFFLGPFAYCLIFFPLPLIVMVASFFGYRKLTSGPNTCKICCWELSKPQQHTLGAAALMAMCWSIDAVLFWMLGATVTVVALHASFFDAEAPPQSTDKIPLIEEV